jgi:hypothetical protein
MSQATPSIDAKRAQNQWNVFFFSGGISGAASFFLKCRFVDILLRSISHKKPVAGSWQFSISVRIEVGSFSGLSGASQGPPMIASLVNVVDGCCW